MTLTPHTTHHHPHHPPSGPLQGSVVKSVPKACPFKLLPGSRQRTFTGTRSFLDRSMLTAPPHPHHRCSLYTNPKTPPTCSPLPVDLAGRRFTALEGGERAEPRWRRRTPADARRRGWTVANHDTDIGRLCRAKQDTRDVEPKSDPVTARGQIGDKNGKHRLESGRWL